MDRNAIVNEIKNFNKLYGVSVDDIVVGYEAAAVMHGIRYSASGIDVDVHPEEFEMVAEIDGVKRDKGMVGEIVSLGKVGFHKEEHRSDFELIDGIWVVGRKTLLRQYRWMFNHPNRDAVMKKKDLHVIKALR